MAGTRTSKSKSRDKQAISKRTTSKQPGPKLAAGTQPAKRAANFAHSAKKAPATKQAAGGSTVGKRFMMVIVAVACVVGVGRMVQGHATTVPNSAATAASLGVTSQSTTAQDAASDGAPIYSVGVPNQAPIPQDALRLRVIANSDSATDQAVKLKVRDAIVVQVGQLLQHVQDAQQARATVTANLPQLQDLANQVLRQQGFTYHAVADVGEVPFPTKIYGNRVYPAGNYEALRITLGSGQGQNWWCVLFPPLCFVDITDGDAVPNTGGFPDLPPLEEVKVPTASGSQTEVQVRMATVDYGEEFIKTVKQWVHG